LAESHDFDEAIFGEPSGFSPLIESIGDLPPRAADVDDPRKKTYKTFAPRRHSSPGSAVF